MEGGSRKRAGGGRFTAPGENSERASPLLTPGVGRRPAKTGLEGQSKGWWEALGIEQRGSGVLVTELSIAFGHRLLTTGLCEAQGRKRLWSTIYPERCRPRRLGAGRR